MFGMGTGGSLRLLSPETKQGLDPLAAALPLPVGSAVEWPPDSRDRSRLLLKALTQCVRTLKTAQVGFLVAPDQGAPFIPDILFLTNLLRASLSGLWFRFALAFPIPYSLIPIPSFQDQALDRLVSPSCMCYHTSTDDLSTLSSSRGLTCS